MKLVITMSRRYGTGASQIAEELSGRLHVPVYDKAIVKERMDGDSYESEASVIRELAKEPCIILGRCASEILKEKRNVFNVYICADKEDRIRRKMELEKRRRRSLSRQILSGLHIIMSIPGRHGGM